MLLLSSLFLLACAQNNDETFTLGIAIPSYVHSVAWITQDKGFFQAHGLHSEINVMGGSAATMRALIAGRIEVGLGGGDAVIKANRAGADLVIIAALVNRFYHRLVVRDEIKTPADLKGKTIGLPFLGGPQDMAVHYALDKLNLQYAEDVGVLSLGKAFNRMAALSRNDIQGTTSQLPPSQLHTLGVHVIADLPAWDVPFPYLVVAVQQSALQRTPGRIKAFLSALCDGIRFYRDPAHQTESLHIMARYMPQANQNQAIERYHSTGPHLISWPPEPVYAGFDRVQQFLGTTRSTHFIDLTLLKQLQHEGPCRA